MNKEISEHSKNFDVEIFPKAPIVEAIINIQIPRLSKDDLQKLADAFALLKDKFPEKKDRIAVEGKIEFQKEKTELIDCSRENVGFIFSSHDKKTVVQFRLDGFSLSRLKPYVDWETFLKEARELWGIYLKFIKPKNIEQLSLRYINRIEIPLPFDNFNEYILVHPEITKKLPQVVANFFMRLVMPFTPSEVVIINETIEGDWEDKPACPLIFDIDVIHKSFLEISDEKIWETFRNMRKIKNDIFFNSLTDKAKELFR